MHRILTIGLPDQEINLDSLRLNKDEELAYCSDLLAGPTLYDYDIILLHGAGLSRFSRLDGLASESVEAQRIGSAARAKKEEFQRFFSMPSVLVVFPIGTLPKDVFPLKLPGVAEKEGEVINLNRNHPLSAVLRSFQFNWVWHLKDKYPDELVIAKNSPGLAVSYEVKLDSGAKVFFLPSLVNPEEDGVKFLRMVLNVVESNYLQLGTPFVAEPKWATEYLFPEEDSLRKQDVGIRKQLTEYEALRQVLYFYGEQLSYSVYLLFKKMGFKAMWKEREGQHDVELDLDGILGIVDVKGLKGPANNDDLRQLLDHYIEKTKTNEDVKGIFVINHFRDVEPKKRGEPFTKAAIRLAEGNNFCLMTTVELFELLGRFLKDEMDTAEINELMLKTKGKITL